MPGKRVCEFCGKPLPPNSAPQRRFHNSCRQNRYMAKLLTDAGRPLPKYLEKLARRQAVLEKRRLSNYLGKLARRKKVAA